MNFGIRFTLFAGFFFSAFWTAMAGGGSSGYLVIYDRNDVSSVTIANHYQQVRGIPERNMIPYNFPSDFTKATAWDFVNSIRSELTARGISSQFQGIALAGVVPSGSSQTSGSNSQNSGNITSLESFLFLSPNYTSTTYPADIYVPPQKAFHLPPAQPSSTVAANRPISGYTYWPVSNVAHTGKGTFALPEALDYIDRAKSHDGAKPDGTIYWCLGGDYARVSPREPQLADVVPVWKHMGMRYSVPMKIAWVSGRSDIVGGVVGSGAVVPGSGGNQFLPGAWADHLTSFGGSDGYPSALGSGQMHSSAWIRAGADGSAGTYSEPYNDARKYPHGHIYTHFRAGCSMAEAFWQSIQTPGEIIALGDPLEQPYADFPQVIISAPAKDAALSGTVNIAVSAQATGGKTLETNRDLFVDGRRIAIGQAGETVNASRMAGGFSLDTNTLTDGWHELRVAAYNSDAVRTQSEAAVPVTINNHGYSLEVTGPSAIDVNGVANFSVTPVGSPALTTIELRMNGRVLGTPIGGNGGNLVVNGSEFPLARSGALYAVGKFADGKEIWSLPFEVTPDWPAQAPVESPLLGSGFATIRYFSNTVAAGFSWDTTSPTAVAAFVGSSADGFSGLAIKADSVPGVTISNYTTKPGYEVDMLYYAPADDVYEFSAEFDYRYLTIVSFAVDGRDTSTGKPQHLAAGWHRLRFRLTFSNSAWSLEVYHRSGLSPDYADIPLSRGATEAGTSTEAPPEITSVSAAASIVTGKTVQLNAVATNPTGAESGLIYTWSLVRGPASPSYSANASNAAKTTTATFTKAGDYVIGLRTFNGTASSSLATVAVTVVQTGTKVLIYGSVPSTYTTNVIAGYPSDFAAAVVDQFNVPMPNQPEISWSTNGGTVTPAKGPQTSGRWANPGTYSIKAWDTAGVYPIASWGSINVTANSAPSITNFSVYRLGTTQPIALAMTATDADDDDKIYLSYKWTATTVSGSGHMTIADDYFPATTAIPSGPGNYTLTGTVTDGAGVSASKSITIGISSNGTLTNSPSIDGQSASPTVLLGDTASIFVSASGSGTISYQWQVSNDAGATWQDVIGATSETYVFGPVALSDNGKKFRARVSNSVGSVISDPVTITVDNPAGGVIRLVPASTFTLWEDDGQMVFTLQRTGGKTGTLSVKYNINSLSATAGSDFTLPGGSATGTITWASGDNADKQLVIPIINDQIAENSEYFYTELTSVSAGTGKISANSKNCKTFISDDDGAAAGMPVFASPSYIVREDQGSVVLTVRRAHGRSGSLAVTYTTSATLADGSVVGPPATAGTDYTAVSGSLTWASGDTTDKQIKVPIRKDLVAESRETFYVRVQPTGGTASYAQIFIDDVASAPMEVWQDQWWPGVSDSAVIGDTVDPDGDGMSNLLEYAAGSDPTHASLGQPVVQVENDRLKISFTRAKWASDIVYRVEGSNDLTNWEEIWNSTSVPYGGGDAQIETVTVRDIQTLDSPGMSKRFLYLRITK